MIPIDNQPLPLWARAAVCYLFLPLVIFAFGWLRLWISIPLVACISASVAALVLSPGFKVLMRPDRRQLRDVAVIAGIALAFALLTGLCDRVPQSTDYLKHNLILGDLIERPWPVRYSVSGNETYLCYGLGYYMVPAAISKVCGVAHIGVAGFAWAALGLFLFFIGLTHSFKRFPLPGVLVFLLCSGLGAFYFLFKNGVVQSQLPPGVMPVGTCDFILHIGLFTSNLDSFTRMFYQPQHAICGWLGGLLMYELLIPRRRWSESAAVLAAIFFWSPVTASGLAVIGVVALVMNHRTFSIRSGIHLVTAALVILVLAAYFAAHVPIAEKGFIWQLSDDRSWIFWYLLFITFFAIIPASAVFWLEWKHPYLGMMKPVVVGMTVLLVVSPIFKLGYFGDLRMQISGPAFLFIAVAMTNGLLLGPARERITSYLYLIGVFIVGAMSPVIRCLDNLTAPDTNYTIQSLEKDGLNQITDLRMSGFDVTAQYLGDSESNAAEFILKPMSSP